MLCINGQGARAEFLSKPQMTLAPELPVLCLWDLIGARVGPRLRVSALAFWADDDNGYPFQVPRMNEVMQEAFSYRTSSHAIPLGGREH